MSPSSLLRTKITSFSPKTSNSLNKRILRVKPLSFHQPITASTYDSAESIATPLPESDLDDEQLCALLATPLYLQEREASAERRSQVSHSDRDNLISDKEDFPLRHQQVFGSNEPFFRFYNPASVAESLLGGNRDHLLAGARSEIMKQEYTAESFNTPCISELQRKTYSQRLELEHAHYGFEESQRENFDNKKNEY